MLYPLLILCQERSFISNGMKRMDLTVKYVSFKDF